MRTIAVPPSPVSPAWPPSAGPTASPATTPSPPTGKAKRARPSSPPPEAPSQKSSRLYGAEEAPTGGSLGETTAATVHSPSNLKVFN